MRLGIILRLCNLVVYLENDGESQITYLATREVKYEWGKIQVLQSKY